MDFMWAVEQLKKGKKVKQSNDEWKNTNYIYFDGDEHIRDEHNEITNFTHFDHFIATDWVLFDDDSEWNLAHTWYIGNDNETRKRPIVIHKKHIEDVNKCRDLIIKDISEVTNDPLADAIQTLIYNIINKRFGELK